MNPPQTPQTLLQKHWDGIHTLAAYAVVSSLLVFPHSLSYFNELAGGPTGGIHHLNNSNIDWGQDLLLMQAWKQEHAPNEVIHFAYFGRVNPIFAGIDFKLPPVQSGANPYLEDLRSVEELETGWYAISVTLLQGRGYVIPGPRGSWIATHEKAFTYFLRLQPVDRVGYSIVIYKVLPK